MCQECDEIYKAASLALTYSSLMASLMNNNSSPGLQHSSQGVRTSTENGIGNWQTVIKNWHDSGHPLYDT